MIQPQSPLSQGSSPLSRESLTPADKKTAGLIDEMLAVYPEAKGIMVVIDFEQIGGMPHAFALFRDGCNLKSTISLLHKMIAATEHMSSELCLVADKAAKEKALKPDNTN